MEEECFRCLFCGGELVWDSDSDAYQFSDAYDEDDDAVMSFYMCRVCGRRYEICEPPEEERETMFKDYWDRRYGD